MLLDDITSIAHKYTIHIKTLHCYGIAYFQSIAYMAQSGCILKAYTVINAMLWQ